jgi:hypothetical protein
MNLRPVSFAERIIDVFNVALRFVLMGVLPVIGFGVMVFTRPDGSFFSLLWYCLTVVYCMGGFFFLGIKIWEVWDWKFVIFKRGIWKGSPVMRKVFYKIIVPTGSDYNVIDMYPAWNQLRTILDHTRTKYEKYVLGKWYYDMAFDIMIRNGKPEMYMQFPLKYKDVVFAAFLNNFPGIQLVESEDPYKRWPRKWRPGSKLGPYTNFYATNYGLASSDLYPLRDPATYTDGETPLGNLIHKFLELDPQITVILQCVVRPFGEETKMPIWQQQLQDYKHETYERSGMGTDHDTDNNQQAVPNKLISQVSERIINSIESKFTESHFRVGFKLFVFYPPQRTYYIKNIDKIFKTYCGQIASDHQMLEKKWPTATDYTFRKINNGLFDNILGPILDRYYYTPRSVYRKTVQYDGLLGRSLDVSWDSQQFFLDAQSISTLFHVPNMLFFPDLMGEEMPHNPITHSEHAGFPKSSLDRLQELRHKS